MMLFSRFKFESGSIFLQRIISLGLSEKEVMLIYREYSHFSRNIKAKICLERMDIRDYIVAYGVCPRWKKYGDTRYFGRHAGFLRIKKILLSAGATPDQWPMLAETKEDIYEAIIKRFAYDKECFLEMPAVVVGVSIECARTLASNTASRACSAQEDEMLDKSVFDKSLFDKNSFTIRNLLNLSEENFEGITDRVKRIRYHKALRDVRVKLLQLGYRSSDGLFLRRDVESLFEKGEVEVKYMGNIPGQRSNSDGAQTQKLRDNVYYLYPKRRTKTCEEECEGAIKITTHKKR